MFEAVTLTVYQQFIGQTGTFLQSGCGLLFQVISTLFLEKIKNEFEAKRIESINTNQPNTLVGSIYNDIPI